MDVPQSAAAPAEPTTTAGMMTAISKVSDGTNVIGESMKTFSMTEGKNKKGDVFVSSADMPAALAALKAQVASAKGSAKPGKKHDMWEFRASPHVAMGKTLDDSFVAFLMWAGTDSVDDDNDEEEVLGKINVSKAFRRLESYAEWMEDSLEDLTSSPLTYTSCKAALEAYGMLSSYDDKERLVWWIDLGMVDLPAVKATPVEDSLRCFVWFAHAVMYDPKAQLHGMAFAEAVGSKLSFWSIMTLVPMKLSVKLDRLTIGVLPIKMKVLLILDAPNWMNLIMKVVSVFLSKKMKERLVVVRKDFHLAAEYFGAGCIPVGFSECNGSYQGNVAIAPYVAVNSLSA